MDTPIDTNQIELMRPYSTANLTSGAYSSILPDWLVEDHSRLDRVYAKLNEWERAQPGPFCLVHGDSHMGIPTSIPMAIAYGSTGNCAGSATVCALSAISLRSEEHTSELQSLMRISYADLYLTQKKLIHNVKHR